MSLPPADQPDWGFPAFLNGAFRPPTDQLKAALDNQADRRGDPHVFPGPGKPISPVVEHLFELQAITTWLSHADGETVLTLYLAWDFAQRVVNSTDNMCYVSNVPTTGHTKSINDRKKALTAIALNSGIKRAVDAYASDAEVLAFVRSRKPYLLRLVTETLPEVASGGVVTLAQKEMYKQLEASMTTWLSGL